jgi:hypothetical protein
MICFVAVSVTTPRGKPVASCHHLDDLLCSSERDNSTGQAWPLATVSMICFVAVSVTTRRDKPVASCHHLDDLLCSSERDNSTGQARGLYLLCYDSAALLSLPI